MKFEPKDYIAALTAVLTVGTVVWKGGQITATLEATNESVKQLAPVVNRLDASTARLEARSEANSSRINDLARRVDNLDAKTK